MNIPDFLLVARAVSYHSEQKCRLGAVIVRHGTPISVGFNRDKSHPRLVFGLQKSIHAEVDAIANCDNLNLLRGCTIFVYRETTHGDLGMARPCANCLKVLRQYGIKRMVYTTAEFPYFNIEKI